MSQTILIESNEDLKKIYALNLNSLAGTEVILRDNADEAIELLKILPQVNLIISRAKIGSEDSAQKIYSFIKTQGLQIAFIMLGNNKTISDEIISLQDPVNWEELIRIAALQLNVTLKDMTQRTEADFHAVSLHYFYEINRTPCDIYLKIKKSAKEFHFIKRIHSKDQFELKDIRKYEEQGLREFYVTTDSLPYFTTFVTNHLIQKLERNDLQLEDRIRATANAHDIAAEIIKNSGFDELNLELSEASIASMIKSVKESPKVGELLKLLFTNKISYAYQHNHLMALMSHYVLSKQSWYKERHLETLSFVSFFSDITLTTEDQMQISSVQELEKSELTMEEKNQVMNHARDAVGLLDQHPEANEYVKTVLLQSHGTHDGIGFEESPGEDLHPLSKVFIVADNFVKMLLNPKKPSHKKDILPLVTERFTNHSYLKILKALEQKY